MVSQSNHCIKSSSCRPFAVVGATNRSGELEIDVDGETGDPTAIHPFLAEISKDRRKSVDGDIDTGAAALHLAVRCGSGACLPSYFV